MVLSPTQKLSPQAGKVSRRSRDERGMAQSCQVPRGVPPQSAYADSSPASGGAFWCFINLWQKHGDALRPSHLHNLSRSPAVRRISHGGAIFHIAQAIFHCALAQFHCGRKPAYIVPVTTTVVTPGVTLTTPVVVSCVNVAAGTVSVVAAPVSGRVSTPAV